MKKVIIFLLSVIISASAYSQNKIKGYVIDSLTQKPVYNAKITNIATKETSFSGYNGYFELNSKYTSLIKISHISYKAKTLRIQPKATVKIFLSPQNNSIQEIVISSDKLNENTKNSTIFQTSDKTANIKIYQTPLSVQDYLKNKSFVIMQNPFGIYTNSPLINFAGAGNDPGRTLVSFDGIKLNKSDDGNINWNMLPPNAINTVSLSPDALSLLYGSSAMNGAIAFRSQTPDTKGFSMPTRFFYGTYNTFGSELTPQYKHNGESGFYTVFDAFAQKSNGYINTPDSLQMSDIEYIPTFLQEAKINLKAGYDINRNHTIEIITNFFDDKRSSGEKIQAPSGSYTKHTSYFGLLKYRAKFNKASFGVNFYAYNENYFKNIESLKHGEYSLIYANSNRHDAETDFFYNRIITKNITLNTGITAHYGSVNGIDEYQTSTDKVINSGQIIETSAYLNTIFKLLKNKNLIISSGINTSLTRTLNPVFEIENATSATDFMMDYTGNFQSNTLKNITYSAGVRYNYKKISFITSYNKGYRNPTLEDLTRSGFMRLGFKIANPLLKPEILDNYSTSIIFDDKKLKISCNAGYSNGKNYMYYIETGDYLFGGRKPVIQKQNITGVSILNASMNFEYNLKNIGFFANYTYTDAHISKFDSIPELVGKKLTYTPSQIANAGIRFKINNIIASASTNLTDKQYTDDYNTSSIAPFYTFDAKLQVILTSRFKMSLAVQNLLNYQYIVYYDQLSLGRFITFEINYRF